MRAEAACPARARAVRSRAYGTRRIHGLHPSMRSNRNKIVPSVRRRPASVGRRHARPGINAALIAPARSAIAAALALLGLAACGQHNPALEPYARATLEPGVGLGDLKLGQTTLESVVQRFGVESLVQVASDEVGLELLYEHGQLALLFLIDPECLRSLPNGLRPASIDLPKFLEQNACLRTQTLASLSVREGSDAESSFYQGQTDKGVKLWADRNAHGVYGQPGGGSPHLIAGLNPNNPREQFQFQCGIAIFLKAPPDGDPAKAHVQRITVYPAVD